MKLTNQSNQTSHRSQICSKSSSFIDQIDLCKCNHMIFGHQLCKGKCDYENCNCETFVNCEIEFVVCIEFVFNEFEGKLNYEGGIF